QNGFRVRVSDGNSRDVLVQSKAQSNSYKNSASRSTVELSPSASKFARSQRFVTDAPLSRSWHRNSRSGFIFEATECAVIASSSRIEWISICFISEAFILPESI